MYLLHPSDSEIEQRMVHVNICVLLCKVICKTSAHAVLCSHDLKGFVSGVRNRKWWKESLRWCPQPPELNTHFRILWNNNRYATTCYMHIPQFSTSTLCHFKCHDHHSVVSLPLSKLARKHQSQPWSPMYTTAVCIFCYFPLVRISRTREFQYGWAKLCV